MAVSTTDGVATVSSQATLNQTPVNGTQTKTDSFTIAGANGVTVSSSGKAITINGDPYQLSSAAPASNSATINLGHGANFGTSAGAITVSSADADHLHITGDANEIELDAPIVSNVAIAAKAENGNGFNVQSTDTFGNHSTATTFDPTITYGDARDQTVHFINGNATLDVYTKAEVDNIKKALNSMTYKGTVGIGGSYANDISGITDTGMPALHIGDTFKLLGDANDSYTNIPIAGGTTTTAYGGDLIIANGTEQDGDITSGSLYYDIVPSGDDIDTYYEGTAITHGWKIEKATGAGADLGGIALVEGTAIGLVDGGTGNNRTVTINHANVNNNVITVSSGGNVTKANGVANTFTAITGINVNQQGHVTSVDTATLTLASEDGADLSAVTNSVSTSGSNTHSTAGTKSSVTIGTAAQMTKNSGSAGQAQSDHFTLSSDNLDISADATNKDAKINFTWGTF